MQDQISPPSEEPFNGELAAPQRGIDGRYEIERPIGRGGVARVFLARDRMLGRRVALKMLTDDAAEDPAFVERFRREAQAIASFNHPHIVTVYDWGSTGNTNFMVMEYVPDGSLADLMKENGALPEAEALQIAEGVAAALASAHARDIVHRDIKPHNILLSPDHQPKVADFGIARAQGLTHLTQTNAVCGTVSYISPEQARGAPVDGRSDLYSLGVVLYQMVTGRLPFAGHSMFDVAMQHIQEKPVAPRAVGPPISPGTEKIILNVMGKRPEDRYASAEEMQAAIRQARRALQSKVVVESVPARSRASAVLVDPPRLAVRSATPTRTWERPLQAPTPRRWIPLVALPLVIAALVAGAAFASHPWTTSTGRVALHATAVPSVAVNAGATHHTSAVAQRRKQGQTAAAQATKQAQGALTQRTNPAVAAVPPYKGPAGNSPPSAASQGSSSQGNASTAYSSTNRGTLQHVGASASSGGTADTSQAVSAVYQFYSYVSKHSFPAAAQMWSASMRASWPPAGNIDGRFSDTQSMRVDSATVGSADASAGTATVIVHLTETKISGQNVVWFGSWQLVKQNGSWMLNSPTLQQV